MFSVEQNEFFERVWGFHFFFQSYNSWVNYTKKWDATVACYRLGIAWSHMACATKVRLTLINRYKVNLVYL